MSKHTAPTSLRTLAIELGYHAQFGINTPDRNGKHRAAEAPRSWAGVKARFHSKPEVCIPCKKIEDAAKQAAA